jgi:hypothetical protein
MDRPHSIPGITSRGAIQQRMPSDSSVAHTASAIVLSFTEWLMKTSCAIGES